MDKKPDIATPTNTASFCPECGSPQLAVVSDFCVCCERCSWSGSKTQVISVPFSQDLGSDSSIFEVLTRELRTLLAKSAAASYLEFLVKWGFMDRPNTEELARYLSAIASTTLKTIIETRAVIDREKHSGR